MGCKVYIMRAIARFSSSGITVFEVWVAVSKIGWKFDLIISVFAESRSVAEVSGTSVVLVEEDFAIGHIASLTAIGSMVSLIATRPFSK